MTRFCESIMGHVGHTIVGARPMVGARHAVPLLFKTLLRDLMTARRRLPADYVAQFAAGAHGLAPHPIDATHGG
jgi:hypothetical protein